MTLATVVKASRAVSILTAVLLSVISTGASAQVADLTIVKDSKPADDTPFPFFVVSPSSDTTFFTLSDPSDPDTTFLELPVGTYEIWETLPKFWTLSVVTGAIGTIETPNDSLIGFPVTLVEDDSTTITLINSNFGIDVIKTDMLIHDQGSPGADPGDSLKFTIHVIETENNSDNLGGVGFELNDTPDPSMTLAVGSVQVMVPFPWSFTILEGNTSGDTFVRVQTVAPVGDTTTIMFKTVITGDVSLFCNQAEVQGTLGGRNMPDMLSDDPDDPTSGADPTCITAGELPVELAGFEARVTGNDVALTWTTLSETNNAGFAVEMKENTEPAFVEVGFVQGRGTTLEPQSYRFEIDDLDPGAYTFRLKQIDLDGAFQYSPTVRASIEIVGSFYLSEAYPNPFNPSTTLRLGVSTDQPVNVAVFDALGKRVSTLHDGTVERDNVMQLRFDAGDLPSGLYFVRASGSTFAATRTVMLLK